MKICICDDDIIYQNLIKNMIFSFFPYEDKFNVITLNSAEDLVTKIESGNTFDIVFMDIEMKQLSGLEAAEILRTLTPEAIIIFVSNYPQYVFDTFKVEPLHFLVKPFSDVDFQNVFLRALSKYKSQHSTITLKWQSERYVIRIDEIKYIEGYRRHVTIYTESDKYEALGKIPDMQKILTPFGFIRTHQGFLVNMDYIKRFDQTDVILLDGTKVMMSVRKRTEALRAFDDFLKRKKW